jgi:small multidrug resistance pump
VAVVCFYSIALYLLSLTLDTLPVGVVYAIWSGAGVALVAVVGRYFFGQVLDPPALIGIGMIVAGVLVLQLLSNPVVR